MQGHLKEQDPWIELMIDMHHTHSCLEVMQKFDRWTAAHMADPVHSKLKQLIPNIGKLFTPLNLTEALQQ